MKKRYTFLIPFYIFLGACQYDEAEIVLSEEQLVEKIINDPEFGLILTSLDKLSEKMFEKFTHLSVDEIEQIEGIETMDDLEKIYSFSDMDFSGLQLLNEYFHVMNEKYPQFKMINPDKLIRGIEYLRKKNYQKNTEIFGQNNKILDSCDDEFKRTMESISESYKFGLNTCAIVTMATSGAGFAPCLAGLITNTVMATARAIDAHTLCKQNQA